LIKPARVEKSFKKTLDSQFKAVLIIQTSLITGEVFFGDRFVIRRSINSTTAFAGTPTVNEMRFGFAWSGSVCDGLEQPDYQPKQRDLDRTEKPD